MCVVLPGYLTCHVEYASQNCEMDELQAITLLHFVNQGIGGLQVLNKRLIRFARASQDTSRVLHVPGLQFECS